MEQDALIQALENLLQQQSVANYIQAVGTIIGDTERRRGDMAI